MRDESGKLVTRWDGVSFKTHPATGEQIPDEKAMVPQWRYLKPRPAQWPAAEFIVGNPPFIGNKRMRDALGDGYVEALRRSWVNVPDTADFVLYWWDHAAELTRAGSVRRFGLITTNSLRQTFNRRVIERHLDASPPLRLRVAVPDHPWVDSSTDAAVRIAMTVGTAADVAGELWTVIDEQVGAHDEVEVKLDSHTGLIHADLTVGARVGSAVKLAANSGLCFQGMNLVGKGFRLEEDEVHALGYDAASLPEVIKPHCNARDLLQGGEQGFVIDLFGYTAERARAEHPALYQWLYDRVKPERDLNNRPSRRRNWWLFGEPVGKLRVAWEGLCRVIVTAETAKHRVFAFQSLPFCPDHKLYAICVEDALTLGILSSSPHALWSLRAGGTLEDRPTWTNTTTFLLFPFPSADTGLTTVLADHIRQLAEQIDAHRKARQAMHDDVTLTGLYNVLAELRAGEPLSAKEKLVHEHGLVGVLRSLHDDLDAAVLEAYGWSDLRSALADHTSAAADARCVAIETLMERLVALNAKRAAEEAAGTVRWLRPEFQTRTRQGEQISIDVETEETAEAAVAAAAPAAKRPWPAGLPEQFKAVAEVLSTSVGPLTLTELEARFSARGRWRERLPTILDTLEAVGRARREAVPERGWRAP